MSETVTVDIAGRAVTLSNLDKVMYPRTGFTKAEVIDYYARIGPVLLRHLARRPLTLKRYPDGVEAAHFFQKECPDHRPEWLPVVEVPSTRRGVIPFCSVDDVAGLSWLANAGNIELHPLLMRDPDLEHPTHVVFDLDPGEPAGWPEVIEVAGLLVDELDVLGLGSVVTSSGSKGIHVSVPLDGSVGFERSKQFARSMAERLAQQRPELVVVKMTKSVRGGRVLVDWSQNSVHKSTVSVYSLRARPTPTVAAPLRREELQALVSGELEPSAVLLHPDQVLERLERHGDLAGDLLGPGHDLSAVTEAPSDRLATYRQMRRFSETPEPAGSRRPRPARDRPRFVVQEHHATSLHWDLRLEHEGTLVSFAIPKGLPWTPAEDHLAVHTEDHPLEYLTFEGEIPEGNYGAGHMSIWDQGSYEPEQMDDDKIRIVLHGNRVEGRYVLFPWKERNWMIHRVDPPTDPERQPPPERLLPMRPTPGGLPVGAGWSYELAWTGCRVVVTSAGGRATIRDAAGDDLGGAFRDVRAVGAALGTTEAVLDGVVVALDRQGAPTADQPRVRAQLRSSRSGRRSGSRVAVMLFDLLWLDGRSLMGEPLTDRRHRLAELALDGPAWQTPKASDVHPDALLAVAGERGFTALVAKRAESRYRPGEVSPDWVIGAGRSDSGR